MRRQNWIKGLIGSSLVGLIVILCLLIFRSNIEGAHLVLGGAYKNTYYLESTVKENEFVTIKFDKLSKKLHLKCEVEESQADGTYLSIGSKVVGEEDYHIDIPVKPETQYRIQIELKDDAILPEYLTATMSYKIGHYTK